MTDAPMQRYRSPAWGPGVSESPEGEWVRFTDAEAAIKAEVARLTEALERISASDEKMIWGENHEVREALDDALSIARAALKGD